MEKIKRISYRKLNRIREKLRRKGEYSWSGWTIPVPSLPSNCSIGWLYVPGRFVRTIRNIRVEQKHLDKLWKSKI